MWRFAYPQTSFLFFLCSLLNHFVAVQLWWKHSVCFLPNFCPMPALHSYTVAEEVSNDRLSGEHSGPFHTVASMWWGREDCCFSKSSKPNPTCTIKIQIDIPSDSGHREGKKIAVVGEKQTEQVIFFSWKQKVREEREPEKQKEAETEAEAEREKQQLFQDEWEEKEDRATQMKESWVGNESYGERCGGPGGARSY